MLTPNGPTFKGGEEEVGGWEGRELGRGWNGSRLVMGKQWLNSAGTAFHHLKLPFHHLKLSFHHLVMTFRHHLGENH